MNRPTCQDCVAYNKILDESGECRKYPPTTQKKEIVGITILSTNRLKEHSTQKIQLSSEFPQVNNRDWCCCWQQDSKEIDLDALSRQTVVLKDHLISFKTTNKLSVKRENILKEIEINLDKIVYRTQEFRVLTLTEKK